MAGSPSPRPPALTLKAPAATRYGHRIEFVGRLTPARPGLPVRILRAGVPVAAGMVRRDGTFRIPARLARPGPFRARAGGSLSPPVTVRIHPRLHARLAPASSAGRLTLVARLQPPQAGRLSIQVRRAGRTTFAGTFTGSARLDLASPVLHGVTVLVRSLPRPGYGAAVRELRLPARAPRLSLGARGPAVALLVQRLAESGYAAPPPRPAFDGDVLQAVYAFQKAQELPRTGVVDRLFWQRLARPWPVQPRFRHPGDHIEVDVRRQVLLLVRAGRVVLVAPVSTAGIPGYRTPTGRFAVYRKVPGYDPSPLGVLYKPLYFYGGYAIHGNPSVPPYPASHGCVRVPNFVIERLYAEEPLGRVVYVYESRLGS